MRALQVIKGRIIAPNSELLHSFYTIDGYVQVTVYSEAGPVSLSTKSERGTAGPVWNKMLTFSDVALGNTVTVSLYDHKKLSADVLLGQARAFPPFPATRWMPLRWQVAPDERDLAEAMAV